MFIALQKSRQKKQVIVAQEGRRVKDNHPHAERSEAAKRKRKGVDCMNSSNTKRQWVEKKIHQEKVGRQGEKSKPGNKKEKALGEVGSKN